MSVDIHRSDHRGDTATTASPHNPIARIITGSLGAGLVTALLLTLVVFPGGAEATITGSLLLAFGCGWTLIRVLSGRFTDRPQHWTAVPAVAMSSAGLALLVLTPENATLTRLGWVWPPAMLALVIWMSVQMSRALEARGRWLLAPVVAVLAIASVAATLENIALLRDEHDVAAPGNLYDVGGHRLYLECHGHGSPTVVLMNGLGEVSASWDRIISETDATTRVCAYDRAGQGWSQDATTPQDGVAAAQDLHALLNVAGEQGPYVLVGHSIGGPYAMIFADQYPQQVAGLVLLDSSSPEQLTKIPSFAGQYAVMRRVVALAPTFSRLGMGRVIAAVAPSHLPSPASAEVRALTASARGAMNVRDEWSVLPDLFDQAQALTTLHSRPLAVLTASESLDEIPGWAATQAQLAAMSSNRIHLRVESTHLGLLEDPYGAAAAVRAIDDVVSAVRTGTHLSR